MNNTIIKSQKIKQILFIFSETCLLTAIMLLSVFPLSCRVSVSGIEIIGTDCRIPVLENYEVLDSNHLSMEFSESIELVSAGITSDDNENISIKNIETDDSSNGKTLIISMDTETQIGKEYIFTGEVENPKGSTLTFSYRFTGFNNNIPELIITEIADGSQKKKDYTTYEFIELYALKGGNLAGLTIQSINDGENASFSFPSTLVNAGDFITVHFRNTTGQDSLCINEINNNISESNAIGSSNSSWDFWAGASDSRLGASQDIIILKNSYNGKWLQAVPYSIIGKDSWTKEKFTESAELCVTENLWKATSSAESAVRFKTSATLVRTNLEEIKASYEKALIEYPFPSSANEWTRITPSALTPGY